MNDTSGTGRRPKANCSITSQLTLLACTCLALPVFGSPLLFSKVQGIEDAHIRKVAISPMDPSFIAVASDNSLYTSMDGGRSFRKTVVLKSEEIRQLAVDRDAPSTVYLTGSRQCYKVDETTDKIFTAAEGEEIHFMLKHKGILYVATSEGLHYADENLLNWREAPGLRGSVVYSVAGFGDNIYLACDSGAYLFRSGSLKRLFVSHSDREDGNYAPHQIIIDALNPARLWMSTNKGVFRSNDRGETWKKIYITGADNATVFCLAQFPLDGTSLYLCSDIGFFKVDIATGNAHPLFEGLPTSKIKWADFTANGGIYLATDQGLFKSGLASSPPPSRGELESIMKGEPDIHQVQQAALRYNSVHPDKTTRWRHRLKYRALFPRVSLDYDKTIGSSFTSSGHYYATGPNDWGVTFTWDIGDLIWNSYEDDIDNRTKLTTQLRMDILDEVNRLYYERLRLKHEIAVADPLIEDTVLKELRFQELTATLDGYTGGLYTR